MGIRTDPGYELYEGADCVCFPAGLTPKKLFLSLVGCKRGSAVPPGAVAAPNGVWVCEYAGPCYWLAQRGRWTCEVILAPQTFVQVFLDDGLIRAFDRTIMIACQHYLTNSLIHNNLSYYNGTVTIATREIVG